MRNVPLARIKPCCEERSIRFRYDSARAIPGPAVYGELILLITTEGIFYLVFSSLWALICGMLAFKAETKSA